MGARPSRRIKPDDPRMVRILAALKGGCTRRAAAAAGGIHHSNFYRWLDADATLRDAVEKAENEAEARMTGVIHRASASTWQAAAWWLERRRHADFARTERVEMKVDVRKLAADVAGSELDPDELLAEAERILAGEAGT